MKIEMENIPCSSEFNPSSSSPSSIIVSCEEKKKKCRYKYGWTCVELFKVTCKEFTS